MVGKISVKDALESIRYIDRVIERLTEDAGHPNGKKPYVDRIRKRVY